MNIENLSSYAGIVEAIVVVISLVYLAIQMRQNTIMVRAQAAQAQVDAYNVVISTIMKDASVWRRGMANLSDLNEDDKAVYLLICHQFTRTLESSLSQYRGGILEPDLYKGLENVFKTVSASKGYRQYWEIRSQFHGPVFRDWMEENVLQSGVNDEYVNSLKVG